MGHIGKEITLGPVRLLSHMCCFLDTLVLCCLHPVKYLFNVSV